MTQYNPFEETKVLRAAAKDPNTPPDVMCELIGWFPEEVLKNPALPLFLLEDPEWFSKIKLTSSSRLAAMVFHECFPESLLVSVLGSLLHSKEWHLKEILRQNKKSAIFSTRKKATRSLKQEVLFRALMEYPDATPQELLYCYHAKYRSTPERQRLATYRATPSCILAKLLNDENEEVRACAAVHPNAPKDILALLYRAGSSCDLRRFTREHTITVHELESLRNMGPWGEALWARHPMTDVRCLSIRKNDLLWLTALLSRPDLPEHLVTEIVAHMRTRKRNIKHLKEELRSKHKIQSRKERGRRGKILYQNKPR